MRNIKLLDCIIWSIVAALLILYIYDQFGDCMFKFGREYYRCVAK